MSELRTELGRQLARKIDAHGLVVWNDERAEYADIAATVIPSDARLEEFRGSWYELRRRVDPAVAGDTPPRLVVYAAAPAPAEDPLAEIRDMSAEFKLRLPTLIRQALGGQVTQGRLDTLARTAPTLAAVEQALAGDGGGIDVRLISALGTADTSAMLRELLTGARDAATAADGIDEAVRDFCRAATGVDPELGADRPVRLFTGLLLSAVALALDGPPEGPLATATPLASPAQRRAASSALTGLLLTHPARYRQLADAADAVLALPATLAWDDRLAQIPGTRGLEEAAFTSAVARLAEGSGGDAAAVADLATARIQHSAWMAPDDTHSWRARWTVVRRLVELTSDIQSHTPPAGTAAQQLQWYAESGWAVDRAHRRLELARTEVGNLGPLDPLLTHARNAYDQWLDLALSQFTSAVEQGGIDAGPLLRQVQIHDRYVGDAAASTRRTAYVWVDALRLELGHDLRESLATLPATVELLPALAVAPTITPMGMAALLPGAEETLEVALSGETIQARLGGHAVTAVPQRVDRLKARHGRVRDLDLNDAANQSEQRLHQTVADSELILVRSQELDSAGESGMLAAAWSTFTSVTTLLRTVVSRLAAAGVERVVITADHGFIALSQGLGPQRVVDAPTAAVGVCKRRFFIGTGAAPSPATITVPLASCGVTSDYSISVPRTLAVFRAGGDRQFFHGGLSPQELLVPVITVDLDQPPAQSQGRVTLSIAGRGITTGVFSVTIHFDPTLFADHVIVRAVATGDGRPVARVVSGDGVSTDSDVVTVTSEHPSVLTFQVTANLSAGESVRLAVLDAGTGRTLASEDIAVAATVTVEDDLA